MSTKVHVNEYNDAPPGPYARAGNPTMAKWSRSYATLYQVVDSL